MQTHLRKRTTTDILATLKSFKAGESDFIPFKDSQTDTRTFSARYQALKREGSISGTYRFYSSNDPHGTTIVRTK